MIDAEFQAWLKSASARRCVLAEVAVNVDGVETTRYLSNRGYVTGPTETPANTTYVPVMTGGLTIDQSLGVDGSGSVVWGDIEIFNASGIRDSWLDDVWMNRSISVYIGDSSWARADFRLIFSGIVADIDSKSRDRLNLKIRDKLQRLNTPMTENKLGGTSANKDALIPLLFGECHNITPLLTDAATLEYQIHDGAIERIIEVRDNGAPVSFTADLANGKFTLDQTPVGAITVSAQGAKPGGTYDNTIGGLVQYIVTNYGKASDRFTTGDLDAAQLAVFAAANPQPVGIYLSDRANVLQVIQDLCASVAAQPVMSAASLLQIQQITLPPSGTPTSITAANMVERTLNIVSRYDVQAAQKISYCKNWTVQADLQTGLPPEHIELYALEWLTVTASDATAASTYKLAADPTDKQSYLLDDTDAADECDRRLQIWKVPRMVYGFEGFPALFLLQLGDAVTITNSRYGMSSGKTGMVVGLKPDWMSAAPRITVEVLI